MTRKQPGQNFLHFDIFHVRFSCKSIPQGGTLKLNRKSFLENICGLFTLILISKTSLSSKVSANFSFWRSYPFYNCWKDMIIGLSMLMTCFVTVWNEINVKLKLEIQRRNNCIFRCKRIPISLPNWTIMETKFFLFLNQLKFAIFRFSLAKFCAWKK